MGAIEPKDVIRLLISCRVAEINEQVAREVLGDSYATTLSEVAHAFRVKETTVRNTWRRGDHKMPGTTSRGGACKFPWFECLIWWARMKIAASEGRGVTDATKRKQEADARAAEADAVIKEKKAEVTTGKYIDVSIAVSVVKGYANRLRDGLMGLARDMQTMFPAKYQAELTEEVTRKHRNLLTAFSEASINDLRAAANEGDDDDV